MSHWEKMDALGYRPNDSWWFLLHGKPWQAALPSALSDARLEHLWASCQPGSKCQPLMAYLIGHLTRGRSRLSDEEHDAIWLQLDDELVKLVAVERDVRLAQKRLLQVLDRMGEPQAEPDCDALQKSDKPDPDALYRAAYADDEASMQLMQSRQAIQRIENVVKRK